MSNKNFCTVDIMCRRKIYSHNTKTQPIAIIKWQVPKMMAPDKKKSPVYLIRCSLPIMHMLQTGTLQHSLPGMILYALAMTSSNDLIHVPPTKNGT